MDLRLKHALIDTNSRICYTMQKGVTMKEQKVDPIDLALQKFLTQGEDKLNDQEFKCLFEFWSKMEMRGCQDVKHVARYNSIIGKEGN